VVHGGDLYFAAYTPATGGELFRMDGATEQVSLAAEFVPGPASMNASEIVAAGGAIYANVNDGVHGREVYRYDVATGIVSLTGDLYPGSVSSSPEYLAALGDDLYFRAAAPGVGAELFRVDGATGVAALAADIHASSSSDPRELIAYEGDLYFRANDGVHGNEPWRLDGDTGQVTLLGDLLPGVQGVGGWNWAEAGGDLYFAAYIGVNPSRAGVFRVDAAGQLAQLPFDVPAGGTCCLPRGFTAFEGAVYFSNGSTPGQALWRIDGATSAVVPAPEIYDGEGLDAAWLFTPLGDRLHFLGNDDLYGIELFSLFRVPFLPVAVDIRPGSDENPIRLGSGGTVPVALLGAADFDAASVDPASVTLAAAAVRLKGNGTPMAHLGDIDGDGYDDLVVHVETRALELSEGDTLATISGRTVEGFVIEGRDTVTIVP
jgi:ELWxxDGT repeat protein